jgi:hypothetical protein
VTSADPGEQSDARWPLDVFSGSTTLLAIGSKRRKHPLPVRYCSKNSINARFGRSLYFAVHALPAAVTYAAERAPSQTD